MAKIKQLFDNLDKEFIYPITRSDCVYTTNNVSVEDALTAVREKTPLMFFGIHTVFASSQDIYSGIFSISYPGLNKNSVLFFRTNSGDEALFNDLRIKAGQNYIWFSNMLFNCTDAYVDTEEIGEEADESDVEYATKDWTDTRIDENNENLATKSELETLNQIVKAFQGQQLGNPQNYTFVFLEESAMDNLTASNTFENIIYIGLEELEPTGEEEQEFAIFDPETGYIILPKSNSFSEGTIDTPSSIFDESTGNLNI